MMMPLLLSLWVATLSTGIVALLGIPLGLWLSALPPTPRGLLRALTLLPLVLPPTVIGYALLILSSPRHQPGQLLNTLGLQYSFHWTGAVVAAVVVALPLMVLSSSAAFGNISQDLKEAALVFGKTRWEAFWQVYLPLARRGIWAGVLLSFARGLGEFGATLMVAGNIPGRTQTMPLAIYQAVLSGEDHLALGLSLALSACCLVLVSGLSWLEQKS